MNFVIACLRPSQNIKLGIFTGSRAVDGKEMYKKVWCTCKVVVFALSSYCLFVFLVAAASLTCYYLRYIVMSQKQNILGANWIAPADSIPNVFFDSSVVPSFLVRKVENKSLPCSHKLGERTVQVWQNNSRCVRTHEKNSRETVRRLGTIIQSIFCAQSGAGIRLNFWK